ncbi:hypothetical protein L873DRAFT_57775 [Choiromyces venosus 120613-1]|uniref:Uncharacterized protein n=1 Tax=Choiromyces venosus 120613-1 TaxID=1336337 RepID=A0A3N4JA14_9PEZI|nr:hypothetical protein L873DRAFT_57775 [Choiromyces venosus 120613-1]
MVPKLHSSSPASNADIVPTAYNLWLKAALFFEYQLLEIVIARPTQNVVLTLLCHLTTKLPSCVCSPALSLRFLLLYLLLSSLLFSLTTIN